MSVDKPLVFGIPKGINAYILQLYQTKEHEELTGWQDAHILFHMLGKKTCLMECISRQKYVLIIYDFAILS